MNARKTGIMALRIVAIILALYVGLALYREAKTAYYQPQGPFSGVLRTIDDDGEVRETVLGVQIHDKEVWVESGHWFRGWYYRLLKNPNVELVYRNKVKQYTAVPVNTPEAVDLIERSMGKGKGFAYWRIRAALLFAPIKPVRLDPR